MTCVEPVSPYATPRQVAAYLGVTPRTVRNWAAEGLVTVHHTPTGRLLLLWAEVTAAATRVPASLIESLPLFVGLGGAA